MLLKHIKPPITSVYFSGPFRLRNIGPNVMVIFNIKLQTRKLTKTLQVGLIFLVQVSLFKPRKPQFLISDSLTIINNKPNAHFRLKTSTNF